MEPKASLQLAPHSAQRHAVASPILRNPVGPYAAELRGADRVFSSICNWHRAVCA